MLDGKTMIDIIYEDNHLLVVKKPPNILVQADNTKDEDLLTILKADLKKRYNKPNNVYLGLVHRLDRPVGGVMVFAKTSKAASRLSDQIRTNKFHKIYLAVVENTFKEKKGQYLNYLLKDHKTNMVKSVSSNCKDAKKAILNYEVLEEIKNLSLVKVFLETGRSHQIRVQFSTNGHPLVGDQRYNKNATKVQIALWAYELGFYHPITNEFLTFKAKLPDCYPFSSFKSL